MKTTIITGFLALGFGLIAASAPGAPVGIITDGASDFWKGLHDAAMAQAAEQGIELDFQMPAPATVEKQQELANQMVANGVQALAICPLKPAEQAAFLKEVSGKTVLLTVLVDAPDSGRRAFLGRDEKEVGRLLGEIMKQSVPEGCKVMPFCGEPAGPETKQRLAGLNETAGELFFMEAPKSDQGDKMLSMAHIEDTLTKRPEIAALIGLEQYHAGLMMRSVVEKGRARMVRVIGTGMGAGLLKGLQEGIVHGLVVDDAQGAAKVVVGALKALAEADAAYTIPEDGHIVTPSIMLNTEKTLSTQETMDALKVQVPWISEATVGQP